MKASLRQQFDRLAFRLQELDTIALHPPIQRFLQRWQPGDPAVYLGEMWVP